MKKYIKLFLMFFLTTTFFVVSFLLINKNYKTQAAAGTDITLYSTAGTVGASAVMRNRAGGYPVISFSDETNHDAMLYDCTAEDCSTGVVRTLESTGSVGSEQSMDVRSNGRPFIAHYDGVNDDLRIYNCTNVACSTGTARIINSNCGQFGISISVLIRNDNRPIVFYWSTGLRAYDCSNVECTTGVDRSINNNGGLGAAKLSPDGLPVAVQYQYGTNIGFYACTDVNCSTGTYRLLLTGNYWVAKHESFIIRSNGDPLIFYYNLGTKRIGAYSCNDDKCTSGVDYPDVIGVNAHEPYTATILPNGLPALVFAPNNGTTNAYLTFFTCSDTNCSTGQLNDLGTDPRIEGNGNIYWDQMGVVYRPNNNGPLIAHYDMDGRDLNLYQGPMFQVTNLSANLDVFDLSTSLSVESGQPNGLFISSKTVRVKESNGLTIADLDVDFMRDRNWSTVSGGSSLADKKSFILNLSDAPGVLSPLSFYVPKSNQSAFVLCPNASSLSAVTTTCAGYSIKVLGDPGVSVVTIDAQDYWRITGQTNTGGVGTSYIKNLAPSLDAVKASSGSSVEGGNGSNDVNETVRIQTTTGSVIADIGVDMTEERSWSGVSADTNLAGAKSVVSGLTSAPGAATTFSLYIPKLLNHTGVWMCPSATTLVDVNLTCIGGYRIDSPPSVNIGGVDYWRVDSLASGGGLGENFEAPTEPTNLYVNETYSGAQLGLTNPVVIGDSTPVFSAIYNDPGISDIANKYRIVVYSDSGCIVPIWDSGATGTTMSDVIAGNRSSDIDFGGTPLEFDGRTYYWQIKFWDDGNNEGDFSLCGPSFKMLSPNEQLRLGTYFLNREVKRPFSR